MSSQHSVLQVDEDLAFQVREWRLQRVGWGLLCVFVAGASLGVFGGGGVLSTQVATTADGTVSVTYDRFVRVGASTALHVRAVPASSSVELRVSRAYYDAIRVQRITPEPHDVTLDADYATLAFASDHAPWTPVEIVFQIDVQATGHRTGSLGLPDGAAVPISQWVFF